jgi:hypothetical protein
MVNYSLNRGRDQFLNLLDAPMILYCKKYVRLAWLNNVVGVYLVQVSLLLIRHGPVLIATAAKLGIRQERGTRDKPSQ